MELYDTHSVEPGLIIDESTGEILGEIQRIPDIISEISLTTGNLVSGKFNESSIRIARNVSSKIGEQFLCYILGGKKAKKRNNKGFDIHLENGKLLEAKTCWNWGCQVIKNNQLEEMEKDCFFGFVFYKTKDNKSPTSYTSQNNGLSPSTYLERNLFINRIVILPRKAVVWYYNTCEFKERNIGSSGVKYKPLRYKRSLKEFNENKGNYEKFEVEKTYGKHRFTIYSLGLEIK